ncbi:hypothetical protein [Agrobacterium albertimagni]|uniref:hypothetical protein n=1 Tax=Agrobacterium albertimagni TaxID=147266 RepID=UPI00142ED833|nr:hypothetical protein [Agrobacterium albertimagni]
MTQLTFDWEAYMNLASEPILVKCLDFGHDGRRIRAYEAYQFWGVRPFFQKVSVSRLV